MKHTLVWGFLLTAAWWLWSAHTELLIIIFGVGSIILTLYFFARMDRFADEHPPYTLGLRPLWYLPYLLWEIVKANIDVTLCVLGVREISPRLIQVPASQKTAIGQTIYANSITLTPGTISLDVRDGVIMVHALTKGTADGLSDGNMDRKATWVEGLS